MSMKITSTINKVDDGNLVINYVIPNDLIQNEKIKVLSELAKEMTLPGFRKGMAPIAKVEANLSTETINEHILNHLLPSAFADSVKSHKINPAIYPKFEVTKIGQGSDWEIKATTCELPKVNLGNYKSSLKGKTQDEIIKELPKIIKLAIPKLLIEEEVNNRLSQLLARIEKLGLQLEGYLASVGKDVKKLREEYEQQSEEAIAVELILNEIANDEKIEVSNEEVEEFVKSTGSDKVTLNDEQKRMLTRVVLRRKALEKLTK